MTSARLKAPSLVPNLIYGGKDSGKNVFHDESQDEELLSWFESAGGIVHRRDLSFMAELEDTVQKGKHEPRFLTLYGGEHGITCKGLCCAGAVGHRPRLAGCGLSSQCPVGLL